MISHCIKRKMVNKNIQSFFQPRDISSMNSTSSISVSNNNILVEYYSDSNNSFQSDNDTQSAIISVDETSESTEHGASTSSGTEEIIMSKRVRYK